jgi:hypothetical protein
MKKILMLTLVAVPLFFTTARSQGYQALHGSAYTGSTAVFNNPAASVNSAYKWDVTILSAQAKLTTNSAYIKNFSFGKYDSAEVTTYDKYHSRFYHANVDVGLFNILYKINNRQAVNVGMRVRSYTHVKTLPFNFADTTSSLHSFLVQNANTPFLDGFATSTSWLEADMNYSQVLFENSNSKLSGGITLQIMKGLAGSYMRLNKLSYLMSKFSTDTTFSFTNGTLVAGYSANLAAEGGKEYMANTVGGLGLSLGIEYMTYNSDQNPYGNHNLNYDWKIGVSLMDLGANNYKPGVGSGTYNNPQITTQDADIDRKLSGAPSVRALSDSLKTIFLTSTDLESNFSISNPTRLIINIDKNFGSNFYVNGEVSMNFYSSSNYTKLRTRELNLLTITPRWETIGLGAYLPVQYNTQGQLWVGAAFKAGPLTMGVHDLGIIFKKDPLLNGGAYLMLSVHPFNKRRVLSKMDCYE